MSPVARVRMAELQRHVLHVAPRGLYPLVPLLRVRVLEQFVVFLEGLLVVLGLGCAAVTTGHVVLCYRGAVVVAVVAV